ncbi:MAG: DUF1622 domain-containing protein [Croceibacterium sp.]
MRDGATDSFMHLMEPVSRLLEVMGVAAILIAVVYATIKFLADLRARRGSAYSDYRANLGRGILIGLELLVGADIIATVTAPLTWESVGLLAVIVVIRTLLSFALETEIEGRFPWRRGTDRAEERQDRDT